MNRDQLPCGMHASDCSSVGGRRPSSTRTSPPPPSQHLCTRAPPHPPRTPSRPSSLFSASPDAPSLTPRPRSRKKKALRIKSPAPDWSQQKGGLQPLHGTQSPVGNGRVAMYSGSLPSENLKCHEKTHTHAHKKRESDMAETTKAQVMYCSIGFGGRSRGNDLS